MLLISILAAVIGIVAGCITFLLYKLIGLFTNLFFFHCFATDFSSVQHNHLALWVIVMPVIGGVTVGFMAKYGSPKIKGHGIPEAMEAVLANRSRIELRVAVFEADFHGDRDRDGRAFWCRRADYSNRGRLDRS